MKTTYKIKKVGLLRAVSYSIPPVGISRLFFRLSQNEVSYGQWVLAFILLLIPWSSYLQWKLEREPGLPIFAIISFMYWIYYALSLFWGARTVSGDDNPGEINVPGEMV